MKRYFIIFLTLVVVLASFPVAVSAEDFAPVQQEMTDLFSLSNNDRRMYHTENGSFSISFDVGGYFVGYVEFLFYTNVDITSMNISGRPVTYVKQGINYRVYAEPLVTYSTFTLNITGNTSSADLYFFSAEFCSNNVSSYTLASKFVSSTGSTVEYNYNGSSLSILTVPWNSAGFKNFSLSCIVNNWKLYDYLNFSFLIKTSDISSISVGFADTFVVPYTVSYVKTDPFFSNLTSDVDVYNSLYYVKINVDLSSINLKINNNPFSMIINGTLYSSLNSFEYAKIHGCYGFITSSDVDPLIFWFRKTYTGLASWFNSLFDQLQDIYTGRSQDQTAADSFNDAIDDQSNELEDLTADLNSVTRPPLSDVNLSTSTMVDSSTIVLATSGLGSIMSNTIILRVLLMALTFALAGFILFGKR